jgi:hypothetical protein
MPQQQQRCVYCNEPATLLCDFILGWGIGELVRDRRGPAWNAIDTTRPPHTCDMPMCLAHAEHRGTMHVRMSRSKNGRRGFFDTFDHCLEHAGQSDTGAPVIPDDEAERLRRAVHALAQRRAMRERGVLPAPPRSSAGQLDLF